MSCYEWESGTLVIPSADWAKFKAALRDAFNKAQTHDFELAQKAYDALLADAKGKRGYDWLLNFKRLLTASQQSPLRYTYGEVKVYPFKLRSAEEVFYLLTPNPAKPGDKPRRPLKKDFPLATGKTVEFDAGDGGITLIEEGRSVRWAVSEGNRACERARESYMGKRFFELLRTVKWTRGSGGDIVGNNEYNRDDMEEGGGGNLVTGSYGPTSKDGFRSFRVRLY
ncbi:hypothetical protein F6X40_23810 [Paraburkholderia sp. UCT31]|uniref:hypothetical protein n=1 Tax=Paraburkholderia sp. UCT31 TaxID=2615209 RepID=UPI001655E66E|nr:hypothetical protein [Paraburkholderia sp. UCT31]MBC8739743.1 hypothetical protein [Paraburkholderia sp. UCT31]